MDEKAYWIGFNKVPGIGAARLTALLEQCGSAEAAWKASIQAYQAAGLDRRSLENLLRARRELDLDREWQRVAQAGVHIVTWLDSDYPNNLREVDSPPPLLYVRGDLSMDDQWAVAIVGTRRASVYGREVAHSLARDLAAAGVTVVSGLARGIDATAHRAALDAGGRTIAVLGSGVDQIYPPENRGLAAAVAQCGAIVSEYALGATPDANNFPARNRVISGLSKGVVVVEAPQRSGALITARFAADQGRDVFAVPGNILNPGSTGCNELIQQGAVPLLSVNDVLLQLGLSKVPAQKAVRQTVAADPLEAKLMRHLTREPSHIDDLARQSALPAPQVAGLLTMLELKGLVRQVGAMTYVRN